MPGDARHRILETGVVQTAELLVSVVPISLQSIRAINILYRKASEEEKKTAVEAYEEEFSNPYRAAERGLVDEIIMPRDTRRKLIRALEMARNKNQSNPPKKHGNMPL